MAKKGQEKGDLARYRRRRDFARTPEPVGRERSTRRDGASFVVQKHRASHLHYDLRLEWDGVLLSWAIPKGPVPDPEVRRLAIRTEDHPLEYGGFEGVIPEGEYGGGTVMVWDRGQWTPEGDPGAGLAKGHLDFGLAGEKLTGRWTLVRTRGDGGPDAGGEGGAAGAKEQWLLIKRSGPDARPGSGDALLEERPLSVLSGRSMDEIAEDRQRVWSSQSPGGGPAAHGASEASGTPDPSRAPGARKAALPERPPPPQLATLVKAPPHGDDWLHEIKLDGYRLLCRLGPGAKGGDAGRVRLITRGGQDWTRRFGRIARALSTLPVDGALLDGEAVVLGASGRSDFQALQNAMDSGERTDLFFFAFDLLHLDGWDLGRTPLEERKALLEELLLGAPSVLRYSGHVVGGGAAFHREACRMGLEGVISKRAGSPSLPGRGRDWVKVKCLRRQEFVVVGWTEPEGARSALGSLVLGVHDEGGRLIYAGRVGTGFTARTLGQLRQRLEPLARKTPPVRGAPRSARGRVVHWVSPTLVAEVAFTEWTSDGAVRHPSFQGLREDKDPREVVREREEAPAEAPASSEAPSPSAEPSPPKARGRRPTAPADEALRAGGVVVTNPDRVLYPDCGVTKADLIRYWHAVADAALPLLVGRPLTLVRCPQGIDEECFYQKHAAGAVPASVPRVHVPEKSGRAKAKPYLYVDGLPAVLALVQLGTLELHLWNARTDRLDRPDTLVMDLDPGPGVPWSDTRGAALTLRDLLGELGLDSWPRATGGKGLHVVAPLVRRSSWHELATFARTLAEFMASGAPERFVTRAAKRLREGRIYIDHLRNARNATAIATFSPRARPGAPVALPLSWKDLEETEAPPLLSVGEAARIDWVREDPWRGFGEARQSITRRMLEALGAR